MCLLSSESLSEIRLSLSLRLKLQEANFSSHFYCGSESLVVRGSEKRKSSSGLRVEKMALLLTYLWQLRESFPAFAFVEGRGGQWRPSCLKLPVSCLTSWQHWMAYLWDSQVKSFVIWVVPMLLHYHGNGQQDTSCYRLLNALSLPSAPLLCQHALYSTMGTQSLDTIVPCHKERKRRAGTSSALLFPGQAEDLARKKKKKNIACKRAVGRFGYPVVCTSI